MSSCFMPAGMGKLGDHAAQRVLTELRGHWSSHENHDYSGCGLNIHMNTYNDNLPGARL